jgi:alpha-tubulin suppressor-like RCC1 family protein
VLFSLSTPVALPSGETSWVSVAAGAFHTCAITNTNTTYCWGRRNLGQVGIGATGTDVLTPTKVNLADPQGFTAVQADYSQTCALQGSSAYCWGQGTTGGIGNGVNSNVTSPTAVSGGLSFSSLALGMNIGCGLAAVNGSSPHAYSAWCWGTNAKNLLQTSGPSIVNVPTAVTARQWRVFEVGPTHICGVDNSNGKLYCWGDNGLEGGVGQGKLGTQPYSALGNYDLALVKSSMALHAVH